MRIVEDKKNLPKRKRSYETYYVLPCSKCGCEVRVKEDNTIPVMCWDCARDSDYDKAKEELAFMVGAIVIDVEPYSGDSYELSTIRIQTKDGKIIEFEAEGWEERYIGWEKIKDG